MEVFSQTHIYINLHYQYFLVIRKKMLVPDYYSYLIHIVRNEPKRLATIHLRQCTFELNIKTVHVRS